MEFQLIPLTEEEREILRMHGADADAYTRWTASVPDGILQVGVIEEMTYDRDRVRHLTASVSPCLGEVTQRPPSDEELQEIISQFGNELQYDPPAFYSDPNVLHLIAECPKPG